MKNALAIGILIFIILVMWAVETAARRWLALVILGLATLILIFAFRVASARDFGQWDRSDPVSQWYRTLMQPDVPTASCCGEADAYWCDDYFARAENGQVKAFCRITDDRPDAARGRPHREIGTEFEIPPSKLKYDQSNPTGHGVIFLSRGDYVYCFVAPGGV